MPTTSCFCYHALFSVCVHSSYLRVLWINLYKKKGYMFKLTPLCITPPALFEGAWSARRSRIRNIKEENSYATWRCLAGEHDEVKGLMAKLYLNCSVTITNSLALNEMDSVTGRCHMGRERKNEFSGFNNSSFHLTSSSVHNYKEKATFNRPEYYKILW